MNPLDLIQTYLKDNAKGRFSLTRGIDVIMIHRHGFHGQISIVPELSITDVFVIFGKQQPTEKEFMRSLHDANFFEWLEHRIQQFMQFADLGSKHGHKFILQCELKKLHRRRRLRRMAKMGSNHNVKIQKQSEEGL